jgi:hypothetical protein
MDEFLHYLNNFIFIYIKYRRARTERRRRMGSTPLISEVVGLNLGTEMDYPEIGSRFSSVTSVEFQNSTSISRGCFLPRF